MEKEYQADGTWGWLGLIIAGKVTYNLSKDNSARDMQLEDLLKAPEVQLCPKIKPINHAKVMSGLSNASSMLKKVGVRVPLPGTPPP